jgi:uncharacterized membrane protein YjgN (DUF898 family)
MLTQLSVARTSIVHNRAITLYVGVAFRFTETCVEQASCAMLDYVATVLHFAVMSLATWEPVHRGIWAPIMLTTMFCAVWACLSRVTQSITFEALALLTILAFRHHLSVFASMTLERAAGATAPICKFADSNVAGLASVLLTNGTVLLGFATKLPVA